jgi:ATP-dependent DNA ligase
VPAQEKARFIEPKLLPPSDSLPAGPDWSYELKLDGYGAIAIRPEVKSGFVHADTSGW